MRSAKKGPVSQDSPIHASAKINSETTHSEPIIIHASYTTPSPTEESNGRLWPTNNSGVGKSVLAFSEDDDRWGKERGRSAELMKQAHTLDSGQWRSQESSDLDTKQIPMSMQ
jgi:hypothetical protein